MLVGGCLWAPGCGEEESAGEKQVDYKVQREFAQGPLTVQVKLDKDRISIAQTVQLRLEAVIEEGYQVQMPVMGEVLGKYEFGILDYESLPDRLLEEGKLLKVRQYRLEPIVSGTYSIPELKFTFQEKGPPRDDEQPKQYELLTEEIAVEVASLVDEDLEGLTIADIKNVAAPVQTQSRWWIWLVVIAGVGTMAVVVLIWLRRRGKDKLERVFKPAHEIAYQRLRELVARDLVGAGRTKEFYEGISDIVRRYIEHRFDLKAPERTTEEFLQEAGSTSLLSDDHKEMLGKFLQHCDMVKFARYGPTKEEIQKTFDLTMEFIEATLSPYRQIEVTPEQSPKQTEEKLRSA